MEIAVPAHARAADGGASRGKSLVFDSKILRGSVASRAFAAQGIGSDVVHRPELAIERIRGGKYDLLYLDLRQPDAMHFKVAATAFARRNGAKVLAALSPDSGQEVLRRLDQRLDGAFVDPIDAELLGAKAAALLPRNRLVPVENEAVAPPVEGEELCLIETTLLRRSATIQQRLGDHLISDSMPSSLLESLSKCVERARHRRLENEQQHGQGNRRLDERLPVDVVASAVLLRPNGEPCGPAFPVLVGDLSMTGARLAHTRSIGNQRLALRWRSLTIPNAWIAVESEVMRCETIGRFYEIGVGFDMWGGGHAGR
ncbi:hypothetical protein Pla108_33200 [Botrimarina colliarenosi]|uniref:Response regulatory domain-containing protein n=2 Tax=Botrimarina colliarenosi TaxID=2528001 RepID=A0A5C6A7B4_9BACT|nr:hypothetical protein Pla108_33200 [Botrimarina colliarenosi]